MPVPTRFKSKKAPFGNVIRDPSNSNKGKQQNQKKGVHNRTEKYLINRVENFKKYKIENT
jgi:hypothetical protein